MASPRTVEFRAGMLALAPMLLGVVLGTLLPIVTIPVIEWMRGGE